MMMKIGWRRSNEIEREKERERERKN